MLRLAMSFLWLAALTAPAWADEAPDQAACPPGEVSGEVCGQTASLGAWGMIVLGLLFGLVALLPARGAGEAGEGQGLSLLGGFHRRLDSETTGWRRLQWPLLGLVFIALGVANLVGWPAP